MDKVKIKLFVRFWEFLENILENLVDFVRGEIYKMFAKPRSVYMARYESAKMTGIRLLRWPDLGLLR